jgi:hypothetical protein
LASSPGDETLEVILKQLEAVKSWSANGRTPTKGERKSIDIAVRVAREYEGDSDKYAWTRKLYGLDAYVADWPSDERAANATDDDFWDDDEEDDDEDDDQD